MSCVFGVQSDDRHGCARNGRFGRSRARLSPKAGAALPIEGNWWPAAQVQKEERPHCFPGARNAGSGAGPTPIHLYEEGADVHQRTRSPWEPPAKTGHSSVKITPLTGPAQTLAEPSVQ